MLRIDIRQLVRDRLSECPGIRFDEGPDWIKVLRADPAGFEVGVWSGPSRFTVAFDGWHEEVASERGALDLVVFGLSQSCRLAVALRGTYATTWTVEALEDESWTPLGVTGLFLQPFWRRVHIEHRSNRVFGFRSAEEIARVRQLVDEAHGRRQ